MSLTTAPVPTQTETTEPNTRGSGSTQSQPPRWRIATTSGYSVNGYLPPWAEEDPSTDDAELEQLGVHMADIAHHASFPGRNLPVTGADGQPQHTEVLACVLDCRPYAEDPTLRLPMVHLHVIDDFWVSDLDPDALSHIAEELHAQAVWLEAELRPRLIAARDDWAAHQSERTGPNVVPAVL